MHAQVRLKRLVVMLSDLEDERICALAEKAGLPKAVYARTQLLYSSECRDELRPSAAEQTGDDAAIGSSNS